MMKKVYSFGNFNVALTSDRDFTDDASTRVFLTEGRADIDIIAEACDGIHSDENMRIFTGRSFNVYKDADGVYKTYILPTTNKEAAVTVSVKEGFRCRYDRKYSDYFSVATNLFNAAEFASVVCRAGAFFLHSSFVCINNKALLFAGPSGAGKSTRAELFAGTENCSIVNHDKALLYFDGGVLFAAGTPLSGSSSVVKNEKYPVHAIVFPEKAETDRMIPLKPVDAYRRLVKNMIINTWDKEFCGKAFDFAAECVAGVPLYLSECTLDGNSVEVQRRMLGI